MQYIPEIPGYKIEKELGQGGMAAVYLGLQENLNREVAIKILNPEMFQDSQCLQRFLNEAHTASNLNHPNIVTIHDVGQADGICYIVMERLQESLTERVKFKPDGRMRPGEALKIIKQVSEALDYAHNEGVVHRDIKPDNIMFRKDGTPVVVDFGIARVLSLDSRSRLTTVGMILGTPNYMSPEQCKGEILDGQSDFYSLGVVLYEILTGEVPYKADSTAGILYKQVQEPIPKLPGDLRKYQVLITKMMAKEKRERIHSGTQVIHLVDALRPDSRGETIKAVNDQWVFDAASDEGGTREANFIQQPEQPDAEVHSSSFHTDSNPSVGSTSKGPMLVGLLSIPFIIIAIYFLFFHGAAPSQQPPKDQKQEQAQEQAGPLPTGTDTAETGAQNTPQIEKPVKRALKQDEELLDYKQYFILADEYYKAKNYKQALENIKLARNVKDGPEARDLEGRILQMAGEVKEEEFIEHFKNARSQYKSRNYQAARESIAAAQAIKSSDSLATLLQDIENAEAKARKEADRKAENTRLAAERTRKKEAKDDAAYRRAIGTNAIYSYQKYLEKYPNGRHAAEAQGKLGQLKESTVLEERVKDDYGYNTAVKKGTIAAFEDYSRRFPLGRHKTEAKAKIEQLKIKLLREIKDKLGFQYIRFFNAGLKKPAMGERLYETRFEHGKSRFIYSEIAYTNKLFRVVDSSVKLTLVYTNSSGSLNHESKGSANLERASENGLYCRGMGWSTPGKWPAGTYTVTVLADGRKIGSGSFEIY
ncbi:MAG: protein kinase [bacterium]|nr:protein kinase [bacterium]